MAQALRLFLVLTLLVAPLFAPPSAFAGEEEEEANVPLFDEKAYLDFVMDEEAMDELAEDDGTLVTEEELATLANPQPFLTAVSGAVTARAAGAWEAEPVGYGTALAFGATVEVPEGAAAEITYPDGTVLTLRAGSALELSAGSAKLSRGAVVTDYPGLPGGFSVVTPAGRASCRGTVFETALRSEKALAVAVYGGTVTVEQEGNETTVEAGSSVVAEGGDFTAGKVDGETLKEFNPEAVTEEPPEEEAAASADPAPEADPAPAAAGRPALKPAAGQGGLLNLDAAPSPAAAPGAPVAVPEVPGTVAVSSDVLELLEMSNALSEAIGNLERLQKRAVPKKSAEVTLATVAGTAFTFAPVKKAPLAQLYAYLNARAGVMTKLYADNLQPYGSWPVDSLLEKHADFLKSGRPAKDRLEWLVKRIEYLHRTVLPETIRKTDRRLASWMRNRNPFALFTAFRKLAVAAEYRMKLDMNKKAALKEMKKATKLRGHKLLNTPGYPVGVIEMEIMDINHLLGQLRVFYTLGDAVPKGWELDAGPDKLAACKAEVEKLLPVLEKFVKERKGYGAVSMKTLVKHGYLPAPAACPCGFEYACRIARNKAKNTELTVRCLVHGPTVKELAAADVTAGQCAANVEALKAAGEKYLLEAGFKAPGTAPASIDIAIKDLVKKKYLKKAIACPLKGAYTVTGSFNSEGKPVVAVTCSAHPAK